MPMKNILFVSARSISRHGVQNIFYNMVNAVAPDKYRFTWYCPGTEDQEFADSFRRKGVSIVTGGLNLFEITLADTIYVAKLDITRLCHECRFDIIHVATGVLRFQEAVLRIAKKWGIEKRIAHCHSCIPYNQSLRSRMMHKIYSAMIKRYATDYVASSGAAAKNMFGEGKGCYIFKNTIDVKKYVYRKDIRARYREELGIRTGALVIGHTGVFNEAKNHEFLINVFQGIVRANDSVCLLLVGGGRLEKKVREQIKLAGLDDRVIITGYTNQVSNYLCAMDVFLFPSHYEGLGIAVLEAQASGLPCIVSEGVPLEAQISENFYRLPLSAGPEQWIKCVLSLPVRSDETREEAWRNVMGSGYDISYLSFYLNEIYK